ncbi:molybdopterin-dependent oxidoreductase [Pantoea agglomerans]|uniref:nitrate reductase n=1 Tax=Enterobacter agglomerans TaxID=549 RepID=UPI00289A1A00|nr:molybdopterin-dependent oxidoreductase [Pantoea agglomerans]WNK51964.1 molybdopterin-dependent oxidoreductase [Pantoea agglomerans]
MNSTCPYCGVGCGVCVTPQGPHQATVIGDPHHPANAGRLCVKGAALGQTLTPQGRLLNAEINGQRVSLDAALDAAAAGLRAVIDQYGPQAVAFYGSGQLLTEDYYVANKLMKGYIGAANIDTNSRLCMASAVVGYKRALGADAVPCCYEDLEQADLVLLVGSNAAWAHPVVWQRLMQAKLQRPAMRIVVIDPRRTASCDQADLHLPLRPGSDTALFSGLLHWLAQQDGIDTSMLPHLNGVDETLTAAAQWDVAQVAEACDLTVQQVAHFFQLFSQHDRVLTLWCMGINQSATGSDNNQAILNLHLLTGKIGRAGCGPFSLTGQPNAMGGREVGGLANQLAAHMNFTEADCERVQRFWRSPAIAREPGLTALDLFRALMDGTVKAVWIMGTNPAVSMPEGNRVAQALAACPLVIVSDVMAQTDTSAFADILLPAQGWGEKNGTVTNSERRISRQRAFAAAPGDARPDWWLLSQVAQRLGFDKGFNWQHPAEIFREHAALSGFENRGDRAFDISGLAQLSNADWDALRPVQWPVNATCPQGCARLFGNRRFFHPDGKARLRVPATPVVAPSEPSYPLLMNTGRVRDQWHTMTRTGLVPRLMQHCDEPFVALHPADAAAYGVTAGGLARVQSVQGWISVRVRVDAGMRRGELFVPMHWNRQFSQQSHVDLLVAARACPFSGQPALKQTSVRILPLTVSWQGWLWQREIVQPTGLRYWARTPYPAVQRYAVAGQGAPQVWLDKQVVLSGCHRQVATGSGNDYRLLAWRDGELQLAFYAGSVLPSIDSAWVAEAFSHAPQDAAGRHGVLAGQAAQGGASGRIICSCMAVGEQTILQAVAQGCRTTQALGEKLKCGTQCGSCIPELKQLLLSEVMSEE